jgi:hypothetical protein
VKDGSDSVTDHSNSVTGHSNSRAHHFSTGKHYFSSVKPYFSSVKGHFSSAKDCLNSMKLYSDRAKDGLSPFMIKRDLIAVGAGRDGCLRFRLLLSRVYVVGLDLGVERRRVHA